MPRSPPFPVVDELVGAERLEERAEARGLHEGGERIHSATVPRRRIRTQTAARRTGLSSPEDVTFRGLATSTHPTTLTLFNGIDGWGPADNDHMTTYSVKAGDTLQRLAQRFHTSTDALAKRNGLTGSSALRPGQTLAVDQFTGPKAAPKPTTTGTKTVTNTSAASIRFDGKVKVMTINVHKFVPGSKERREGKRSTESMKALQDVADFIKKHNPDVIVLQELDNDVTGKEAKHGVNRQLDRLAKLVGATGKAMASWKHMKGGNGYDNAIITRNGFKIEENVSVKLPVSKKAKNDNPRSVGVADVVAPDRKTHINVLYTHTTPHGDKGAKKTRAAQLKLINKLVRDLRDGTMRVRDLTTNKMVTFRSKKNAATMVGGDLNATQGFADRYLEKNTRLRNVIDMARNKGRANDGTILKKKGKVGSRIDHWYFSKGIKVKDAYVRTVTEKRVKDKVGVTDHRAVIAELKL